MWVSDRTDLLAMLGSLACVAFCQNYCSKRKWTALLGGGIALFFALGAKETAAATLIVTLSALLWSRWEVRHSLFVVAWTQAMAVGAWFLWRTHAVTISVGRIEPLGPLSQISLASFVHFEYLFQLLVPPTLTACDGRMVPSFPVFWIVAGLALSVAALVLGLRAWKRKNSQTLAAAVWVFAFLLPSSGILPLKHVRADRYLYCVLPGLVLLALVVVRAWLSYLPESLARASKRWLLVGTYVYFAVCMALRTPVFASNATFWTHETKGNDTCMEGHAYLARQAYIDHRPQVALQELNKVLMNTTRRELIVAYRPDEMSRYYLGLVLIDLGDLTGATATLQRLLATTNSRWLRPEAAYSLALVDLDRGDFLSMEQHLGLASSYGPRSDSRADILLLRSYANMRLYRWQESERDLAGYLREADARRTPERQRMADTIAAALSTR
jgi:hypothetical protein